MPYIQGSEIQKYQEGSYEERILKLSEAIETAHGKSVRILATHPEHALVVDSDGDFLRASYKTGKSGFKVEMAGSDVQVIEDKDVPLFTAQELRAVVRDGMSGKAPTRTRVRALFGLVSEDEEYWLSDILTKIDESMEGNCAWTSLYESNESVPGLESALMSKIPSTRYASLPENRISDFESELRESLTLLSEVFAGVVDEISGVVFDESDDNERSAVRRSLIDEAQAANSLLTKVEQLMSEVDIKRTAKAHDKLAERAKKMAAVSVWIQALNDDEE